MHADWQSLYEARRYNQAGKPNEAKRIYLPHPFKRSLYCVTLLDRWCWYDRAGRHDDRTRGRAEDGFSPRCIQWGQVRQHLLIPPKLTFPSARPNLVSCTYLWVFLRRWGWLAWFGRCCRRLNISCCRFGSDVAGACWGSGVVEAWHAATAGLMMKSDTIAATTGRSGSLSIGLLPCE